MGRTGEGVGVEVVVFVKLLERVQLRVRVQHVRHRDHVFEAVRPGHVHVVLAAECLPAEVDRLYEQTANEGSASQTGTD